MLLLPIAALWLTACSKTIDFDFRAAEPRCVVEALYRPDGTDGGECSVAVSRTIPYDADPETSPWAGSFSYRLTDLSTGETVCAGEAADFVLLSGLKRPIDGREYRMEVTVGDRTFTAHSLYRDPVAVDEARFEYKPVMGSEKLVCVVSFRDRPGQENYYYCILSLDDCWNMRNPCSDEDSDGRVLSLEFSCSSSTGQMGIATEGPDLRPGDVLAVELRTIDRGAWNFFRTKEAGAAFAPSDPVGNFAGGCLGYFSAYSVSETSVVYLP